MSAHLGIQAAIVAALMAAPAVAGGNVKVNTTRPVSAAFSQAVVVRLVQSRANTPQILGGPYDWMTQVQVECLARAASGNADPMAAVDALLEAVWTRLSTVSPAGLSANPVGQTAVVGGISYLVAVHQPDGTGVSTLMLERA